MVVLTIIISTARYPRIHASLLKFELQEQKVAPSEVGGRPTASSVEGGVVDVPGSEATKTIDGLNAVIPKTNVELDDLAGVNRDLAASVVAFREFSTAYFWITSAHSSLLCPGGDSSL